MRSPWTLSISPPLHRAITRALLCALVVAFAASEAAAERVFFYHDDALGSPVAMTDASGAVVWRAEYEPFGDPASLSETVPNSHQFIGKEYDLETGLLNFGARYYDAGIGRFLSVDPALLSGRPNSALKIPQRLNSYSYSANNPYRYLDSNGNWPTRVRQVHQASISRVLADLPVQDAAVLSQQQIVVDQDQSSAGAFRHSMRAPGQTPLEAWEAANEFVRNELMQARSLEKEGRRLCPPFRGLWRSLGDHG